MNYHGIDISEDQLADLCRKWKVTELSLFGSILRDDFGPDSDINVLVVFQPDAPWSLWNLLDMREELQNLFERTIDLVEKDALRNPFRRHEILSNHKVLYAA
ncbi:MAG: nucleotidyltransferase family protein [Sedimentisphaerales bacterium]|jgi:predicted nucleotidyltransferase|nr:nucleotidyltransferase family protein [Sedimentisphaerales bacterium]